MHVIKLCVVGALCQLAAMTAQAQQPSTLTLACKGTTMTPPIDEKPQAISMGLIVNFTNGTVQGFGFHGQVDYSVKITTSNDVTINFSGRQQVLLSESSTQGFIDRVTGDVKADITLFDKETNKTISKTTYALQCRPTQRMF